MRYIGVSGSGAAVVEIQAEELKQLRQFATGLFALCDVLPGVDAPTPRKAAPARKPTPRKPRASRAPSEQLKIKVCKQCGKEFHPTTSAKRCADCRSGKPSNTPAEPRKTRVQMLREIDQNLKDKQEENA
jgi:hypothetical protein